MADRYDALKLENQICFPLYACSAVTVPERLSACVGLEAQKAQDLYALLYEVLNKLTRQKPGGEP